MIKKALFATLLSVVFATGYAAGSLVNVGSTQSPITMYSEYYPNPKASFKGSIIFQNGAGMSLTEWTQNKSFFNCAKKLGNLFMYDRSGIDKSSPDLQVSLRNPIVAQSVTSKLMILLKKNHVKPPYILVGHSYGGLFAGYFALAHPDMVKAVLLVDPSPPRFSYTDSLWKMYKDGVKQIKYLSTQNAYNTFTFAKAEKNHGLAAHIIYLVQGFKSTKKQINALLPIKKDIPVVVLSSTFMENNPAIKGDWYQQQQQWLNDNPLSHITQTNSRHTIQWQHPKLVCDQIKHLTHP